MHFGKSYKSQEIRKEGPWNTRRGWEQRFHQDLKGRSQVAQDRD